MKANKNHIRQKAVRFKRWSNKSYALFNAIGTIMHIGCLSTIIHKLVTVKSMVFRGFLKPSEALEVSEVEKALISHELAGSTGWAAAMPVISVHAKFENPASDFSFTYSIKIIIKAFSGPFFIAENLFIKSESLSARHGFYGFLHHLYKTKCTSTNF